MISHLNRALQMYGNWEEQAKDLRHLEGLKPDNRDILLAKYDYLSKGVYRVEVNASDIEKITLGVLKGVLTKLEKELYPNVLLRLARQLKTRLIDKPSYIHSFLKLRGENLRSVETLLQSKGMGQYFGKLEQYLDFERKEVHIDVSGNLNENTSLKLVAQMHKNENGGYDLQDIVGSLKHEGEPWKDRTFVFDVDFNVDAVKAANLLMGRAVMNGPNEMNHHSNNQWIQLTSLQDGHFMDARIFQPEQGFDLKRVLNDFAAQTGFYRVTAADVFVQLVQGQQVKVSGKHPQDEPVLLEASPGTGGLILRDVNQKVIGIDEVLAGSHIHRNQQENSLKIQLNSPEKNNRQDQSLGLGS